ncbi:winged helix-turn-helix domain-containing protein [Halorussus salinisoli]|uniref:winged helix-turn-helix domain-containing protein n=1 Tax=Halorussus salinisoli TaxID=2558242 RepID=UPI0010C21208|nr:helix-turn-helix domain-containing protein [Halorussus salinisoli]
MTRKEKMKDSTTLAPDEAFAVLGNETRMKILQTLGEAGFGESLSFSELRERVGIRHGAQFTYHLKQLVGHFVRKTDDGYALRPAGNRVVEAVLSGTVTDNPALDSRQTDHHCPYCGSPIEVHFHQNRLHRYCTACPGTYGQTALPGVSIDPEDRGYLGKKNLPPAGVTDRTPEAVVEAATIWNHLLLLKPANGLCPRCSASLESSVSICSNHDTTDGLCDECSYRHGIKIEHCCPKCIFTAGGFFADFLLTNFDFVAFLVAQDINPVSPTPEDQRVWTDYDEDVLSVEPFEARFTFTIDDDALTLTVDDNLDVVDVTKGTTSETAR